MPDVTATTSVPPQHVSKLQKAYKAYRDQLGLDETFTIQMFLDEVFRDTLKAHWRAADQVELHELKELIDDADDTQRGRIRDILQPPETP